MGGPCALSLSAPTLTSPDQNLLVFPNPASVGATITLQVAAPVQAAAQLSIHAADGRLLGSYGANQFLRTAQGISVQLPAALAPGIYQLAFQQQGTRQTSSLLVTE